MAQPVFSKISKLLHPVSFIIATLCTTTSCSKKESVKEEQLRVEQSVDDSTAVDTIQTNSLRNNVSFKQLQTYPNHVVLTGLAPHRLVTIYKTTRAQSQTARTDSYYHSRDYDTYGDSEYREHFMPGLDLIYGYNLINVAHYDFSEEKLNLLFDHPVLVKSLYFPSYEQDSLDKKPITRNYYLMSAYDADTNGDTLINKKDLRHFYFFTAQGRDRVQLIPADHTVIRSEYDPRNDVMYVFAQEDSNHNGSPDKKEPIHIFWFSLKKPEVAKRLY